MGRIGLRDSEETHQFGMRVAKSLPPGTVLALSGQLGAGKTTFVQGLAEGLGITEPVQSPTFILLNLYEGLAHFDLYRLKTADDFTALGFHEYFHSGVLCAIEWPERIQELLPPGTVHIHFEYAANGGRIANIT